MPQARKFDIVVAGHICFDIIPALPEVEDGVEGFGKMFLPGKLVKIGPMATSTGGPVSNTGLGLKRLGINVTLMGKVGDDFIGESIIKSLKKDNFDKSMTLVKGESTSYTIVICPPKIDRLFLHYPGTNNTFNSKDVNYDIVKRAKLFHLGYPPLMENLYRNEGKELIKIFKEVKKLGVTTSLDMSLPDPKTESGKINWKKVLEKLIPYVDLYLPSAEETLYMLHPEKFMEKKAAAGKREMLDVIDLEDISNLASELLDMGGKIVGIKCGYKGIYLRTAGVEKLKKIGFAKPCCLDNWSNREIFEPAYHVDRVASATGSGDSAIAGLLAAYINGLTIEDTIRTGCAVGWQNVQVMDAVSGIKSWNETMNFIEKKAPKNHITPKSTAWQYCDDERHFVGCHDKNNLF